MNQIALNTNQSLFSTLSFLQMVFFMSFSVFLLLFETFKFEKGELQLKLFIYYGLIIDCTSRSGFNV